MAESTIFEVAAPGYGLRFPSANVADCNSIPTDNATDFPGLYRYDTNTLNRPNNGTGGILNTQNEGYGAQLGIKDGANGAWIRSSTPSNGWRDWEQLVTESGLKALINAGHRYVEFDGKDSPVSVSSATSGGTAIGSITLPTPGLWLILTCVSFPSNSTGYRAFNLSTSSGSVGTTLFSAHHVAAANGIATFIYTPYIIYRTTQTTTYYLNVRQNSGSALSVTGAARAFNLRLMDPPE